MKLLQRVLLFVACSLSIIGCTANQPIRVGILHSLTGTMAISEINVRNATLLAINEINAAGGLNGRQIEPIIVDGASDWPTFAREAERLITQERVSVVFGGWTSASRKTMLPVFEQHNHLLVYPVQYEGLEQSPNILYTGAAPNQQIIPAVKWSLDNLGSNIFLVGSDYVFPRTANAIIRDQITALRGTIVGEDYIPLGSTDVDAIVQKIVEAKPGVIFNTINGDSNIAFFAALRQAGITPQDTPTISFSIGEPELQQLDTSTLAGDYAAWNYFQSIDTQTNRDFVARYQAAYGAESVIGDPMQSAYVGVYLWAQAVRAAETDNVDIVRQNLGGQSYNAPQGIVYVDRETQHTWKPVTIGRIEADGQFVSVWTSQNPIRPIPYPLFRSRESWDGFLNNLYINWGSSWAFNGTVSTVSQDLNTSTP
jgi:urea transport system substrate-binding protein